MTTVTLELTDQDLTALFCALASFSQNLEAGIEPFELVVTESEADAMMKKLDAAVPKEKYDELLSAAKLMASFGQNRRRQAMSVMDRFSTKDREAVLFGLYLAAIVSVKPGMKEDQDIRAFFEFEAEGGPSAFTSIDMVEWDYIEDLSKRWASLIDELDASPLDDRSDDGASWLSDKDKRVLACAMAEFNIFFKRVKDKDRVAEELCHPDDYSNVMARILGPLLGARGLAKVNPWVSGFLKNLRS